MGTSNLPKYAFLSSLYTEHDKLRKDLYNLGNGYLWVAEHSDKTLAHRPPLEIVDTLIQKIRGAELIICVLGGPHEDRGDYDHGTPIKIKNHLTSVSYFEIELFQAALLEKPIALFISKGFSPHSRLKSVLDILHFAFPAAWPMPMEDNDIIDNVRLLLDSILNTKAPSRQTTVLDYNRLVLGFDDARSKPLNIDGPNREILFLDGAFENRYNPPDKELIESILLETKRTQDQAQRLARLWVAIRELMAAPYINPIFKEFRELWNESLGRWASAGAWYGLHNHTYLGCLASLHRMSEVRETIRQSTSTILDPVTTGHPGGALASAYYSISKHSHQRKNLKKALWHIELGIADKSADLSGLYAIRGSIYRQLKRYFKAVDDYRMTLILREKSNAPQPQVGEALSELGFGYLFLGRWFKAVNLMEQGVKLLEQAPPSGFLVRAKKKLSVAYRVTGRLSKARETMDEANKMAISLNILDQLR